MNEDSSETDRKNSNYVALGLILGAALGIVVGAIVDSYSNK